MDSPGHQRRVQLGRVQTADSVEQSSPKKLQFVMPPGQMQLDPAALEQIRRRRPTPAKLVVMNEQTSQSDDRTHDPSEGCALADSESSDSAPKASGDCVYEPPTMEELRQALQLYCTEEQWSGGAGALRGAKEEPNGTACAEVTSDAGAEVGGVAELRSTPDTPALAQSPGDVDDQLPETPPPADEAPRKPRRKDTPVYQVPPLALACAGRVQRRPRDVQQGEQPVPTMLEEEWVEELVVPEETLVSAKVTSQPSVPS